MKLKRIRSKIEEGNLTEKKLEHRTSIAKWYQPKPTTLYKKLGREILESKINFLNLSKPKCQTKQKPIKKLCFTKQSNMFYQTKYWLFWRKTLSPGIRYCDQNKPIFYVFVKAVRPLNRKFESEEDYLNKKIIEEQKNTRE